MRRELGKADARVKDDLLRVHPLVNQAPHPSGQFAADIYSDIVVVRTSLHVAARSPRVHENVGHPGDGDERWHGRVTEAAAHVIDDACPCVEGGLGDADPGGIDTDWDTGLRELTDHRITRCNSVRAETRAAPGLVDSPPTSIRSAPSAAIARP